MTFMTLLVSPQGPDSAIWQKLRARIDANSLVNFLSILLQQLGLVGSKLLKLCNNCALRGRKMALWRKRCKNLGLIPFNRKLDGCV